MYSRNRSTASAGASSPASQIVTDRVGCVTPRGASRSARAWPSLRFGPPAAARAGGRPSATARDDAVASAALRVVEPGVGLGDEVRRAVRSLLRVRGDAEADGDGDDVPPVLELRLLDLHAEPLAQDGGVAERGAAAQDGELLPSVAGEEIFRAELLLDDGRQPDQHVVPGQVPELVVDVLEVVDVQH